MDATRRECRVGASVVGTKMKKKCECECEYESLGYENENENEYVVMAIVRS